MHTKLTQVLMVLAVFTVIVRYERAGDMYGELKMCVDAKSPTAAGKMARRLAAKELNPGYSIKWSVIVRDDRCYWLPDEPGEWRK